MVNGRVHFSCLSITVLITYVDGHIIVILYFRKSLAIEMVSDNQGKQIYHLLDV